MNIFSSKQISYSDILSLVCIFFAASVPYIDSLNSIALYIALPCTFLLCFCNYNVIRTNKSMKHLTFLYLWVCFCYLLALDLGLAGLELKRILGCFILCFSMAALSAKRKLIPILYCVYIVLLLAAWIYAKTHILSTIDVGVERLNDKKLNANTLAYFTLYLTFALFILGEIVKDNLGKITRIFFLLTIPLSFVTAILTSSRQVLLLQVPLLSILIWHRYFKGSMMRVISSFVILIITSMFFYSSIESTYNDSTLKKRSEVNVKDDARMHLVSECIQHGFDRPLMGYGPGNSVRVISTRHFAHNTFLELLVNTGVPGMLLFAYLIYSFILRQYSRLKETHNPLFFIFLLFGFFWLFDQMFYVFYADLWLMSFFVLVSSHSDSVYQDICTQPHMEY